MSSGDKGQIYTLEGLIAAGILIGLLIFILQSVSIVTPQTEKTIDMKLQQKASDILICLDRYNEMNTSELKVLVTGWRGDATRYPGDPMPVDPFDVPIPPDVQKRDPDIDRLNRLIDDYLPSDIMYNIDFYYYDMAEGKYKITNIIKHGDPNDNSVMVKKLVTINLADKVPPTSFWSDTRNNRYPEVVEVRLTAWYI